MWNLLLMHALFASTFTLGKAGLLYGEPIFFVALRALFSGFLLLLFHVTFQSRHTINRNHYSLFIKFGLFQVYFAFVLEFAVLRFIDSAKWSLLYGIGPFITAIFSYFLLKESISRKKLISFFIGFVGLFLSLFTHVNQEAMYGDFWIISIPEIAILLSVISFSYSWILAHRLVREHKYPVVLVNGISMTIGGMLALCTSPLIDQWDPWPVTNWWPFLTAVFFIVVATMATATINTYLLKKYTAAFLFFLGFIDPLYVAFYGWIFLGETVAWNFFASLFFMSIGLYLFYQEELKKSYIVVEKKA